MSVDTEEMSSEDQDVAAVSQAPDLLSQALAERSEAHAKNAEKTEEEEGKDFGLHF